MNGLQIKEQMVNYKLQDAIALVSIALDVPKSSIKDGSSMETLDKWDSLGHMRIILEIEQSLGSAGVHCFAFDGRIRMVTHHDIKPKDIETTLRIVQNVFMNHSNSN